MNSALISLLSILNNIKNYDWTFENENWIHQYLVAKNV